MLQWLQWIETFSAINPYLPGVIKFGVGALVVLGVLIPVSIVATVLDSASKVAITQLLTYLKTQTSQLYGGITSHLAFCAEILKKFIADNSVKYGFNLNLANAEVAKAQDVINNIEEHGLAFPKILETRLAPIADRYEEFEDRLNKIEGMKVGELKLNIPDIEILDAELENKNKGATILFLWVPLAFMVLIINTYLLNIFFSELVPDMRISKTFGLYVSHFVSFMFSAIELAIGATIAFSKFDKNKNDNGIDIFTALAWVVFVLLLLLEGAIYFLLSHNMMPKDILSSGKSIIEFIIGGWLSIMGLIIVIGLLICGHWAAKGYLLFRSATNLQRLKKDLDIAYRLSTAVDGAIKSYNGELGLSVQALQDHRSLSQTAPETQPPESDFLSELKSHVANAREVLNSFSALNEVSQTTIVTEVNQEEVRKVFYTMIFFAIVMAISITASTFVMVPLLEQHPGIRDIPRFAIICIPIFGLLSVAGIGYLWSMQFVMQIGNDIIAHPRSIFIRTALGLSAAVLFSLVVYITGIFPTPPSYVSLFTICLSMGIAMWTGTSLRIVLDAVVALIRMLWRVILITVRWITATIALVVFYLVRVIQTLLQILAFPGRRLYEIIFV